MPLSDRDRAILDFERTWWTEPGPAGPGGKAPSKQEAIRARLSLSGARYYQLVGALIDSPEALVYDPLVVKRLRLRRDERRRVRFEGRAQGGER